MRPTFADPKTDFVFKRIFGGRPSGAEPHKHLLIIRTASPEQILRWAERILTAESCEGIFRDP